MKKLLSYFVLIGLLVLMAGCFVGGPRQHGPHDDNGNNGHQQGHNDNHQDHQDHHDDHK